MSPVLLHAAYLESCSVMTGPRRSKLVKIAFHRSLIFPVSSFLRVEVPLEYSRYLFHKGTSG